MNLMEAQSLSKSYSRQIPLTHAVRDVTLAVRKGETLGLVGESGCGKSTFAKLLLRLEKPDTGRILFAGEDITDLSFTAMRNLRSRMQMIFQANGEAFNPYFTVRQIVGEPLDNYSAEPEEVKTAKVIAMLEKVGLDAGYLARYGREMSGGQRQRAGIARALILEPEFVVCDEAVSSVDFALKRQILSLLTAMKRDLDLTYLFISHDIATVNAVSDRVAVMYLGSIVEILPRVDQGALHPYTRALLAAVLPVNPRNRKELPSLFKEDTALRLPESGCVFQNRCLFARKICQTDRPELAAYAGGHLAACHFAGQLP